MKLKRPDLRRGHDLPSKLDATAIVAVVDSREQRPLNLAPMPILTNCLTTGDYSVRGLEDFISIERKSESDLLACCGRDRKRFDRVVQRLLAYPVRALVIESTWNRLEHGEWCSRLTPNQVLGSVSGWIAKGLPVVMAGDHEHAADHVRRLLMIAARRRYRECREFVKCAFRQPCYRSD